MLKIIVGIFALIGMYFASHFFIGSQENWNNVIKDRFWEFYFSRILFTFIIGGLFFLLSLLLNWIFREKIEFKKKMVLVELFSIIIIAIVMTSIAVLN